MTEKITDSLIQQVANLTANEMMYLIAEANRLNDTKAKKMIAEAVASDIQQHMDEEDHEDTCPECSSKNILYTRLIGC